MPRILLSMLLILCGIGILALPAMGRAGETSPVPNAPVEEPEVLRFAMIRVLGAVNHKDARVAIDVNWSRHLEAIFPGIDSQFELLPDMTAAARRLKDNQLHGLSLGVVEYLQLRKKTKLDPVFISSRVSTPLETYLLLVNRDTDWRSLTAKPIRRLITEKMSEPNIGLMWLETLLKERNMPQCSNYFTKITSGAKPARIVLPVFFGQAEACLVPESAYQTMVELNPQISKRVAILARSPGIIKTIHCTTGLIPAHMVERFVQEGVKMDGTVDGRQLLLIFHVKKNFVYQPEFITNSERIFRKYQKIGK